MQGPGGTFQATARFARGTTCTFTGTLDDPSAPATYACSDRDGHVTLERPLHVGLCRCLVARSRPGLAFCATTPGPF